MNKLSGQLLGSLAWGHRPSWSRGLSYRLIFTATFHKPRTALKIITVYLWEEWASTLQLRNLRTHVSLVSAEPQAQETALLSSSLIQGKNLDWPFLPLTSWVVLEKIGCASISKLVKRGKCILSTSRSYFEDWNEIIPWMLILFHLFQMFFKP